MFLSLIFLPILLFLIISLFGRYIGHKGIFFITNIVMITLILISLLLNYETLLLNQVITIDLFINYGRLNNNWYLLFDQISSIMLIMILTISYLVIIYTYDYMIEDAHKIRFALYIILFIINMFILITTSNIYILFIGWEGIIQCLKWKIEMNYSVILVFSKLNSLKRIGPHSQTILSIIIGSLLGDGHLEKRNKGTRLILEQTSRNVEYLMWIHKNLALSGYCNPNKPKLFKRIRKKGEIFYYYRIKTYTFSSFNWIHSFFYQFNYNTQSYKKIIPSSIENYLTPLALAIWFQNNGSKYSSGIRIATNNFTYEEVIQLCTILHIKYRWICTYHFLGPEKGYCIYISKKSMDSFRKTILPYLVPSMHYKFH